jgi:hypothetical protein
LDERAALENHRINGPAREQDTHPKKSLAIKLKSAADVPDYVETASDENLVPRSELSRKFSGGVSGSVHDLRPSSRSSNLLGQDLRAYKPWAGLTAHTDHPIYLRKNRLENRCALLIFHRAKEPNPSVRATPRLERLSERSGTGSVVRTVQQEDRSSWPEPNALHSSGKNDLLKRLSRAPRARLTQPFKPTDLLD